MKLASPAQMQNKITKKKNKERKRYVFFVFISFFISKIKKVQKLFPAHFFLSFPRLLSELDHFNYNRNK